MCVQQEFYGNPKTEAGVARLVQKADCHKYFQVLDKLLNIIGACIAGYEEMQDVEKTGAHATILTSILHLFASNK
jgi:hypothetical protein